VLSSDDFSYALENTKVLLPPQRRLETFGASLLNYYLITEDMDAINLSRVREGHIQAERPQIVTPQNMSRLLIEGFGEEAQRFADVVSANPEQFTFLKYGFKMQKNELRTYDVHESMEVVAARVQDEVKGKNDPFATVLTGVDTGWEVCLLKFMVATIQASVGGNVRDFRERGLL
jgi:hypothetical protein